MVSCDRFSMSRALNALASVAIAAKVAFNRGGTIGAPLHPTSTKAVVEVPIVGAAQAPSTVSTVIADCAVMPTVVGADAPGANAVAALLVHPVGAREGRAALPTVAARVVFNQAGAIAVIALAPVLKKELAGVAFGAVLAVLAGAMLADLAVGDGSILLVGALAAKANRRFDDEPAGPASERCHAAPLELPNAHRGHAGRAGRDASGIEEIEAVAADSAGVSRHDPVAVVAVSVEAPAVGTGLRPGLNAAALAGDGAVAPPALEHAVGVAGEAPTIPPPPPTLHPTSLGECPRNCGVASRSGGTCRTTGQGSAGCLSELAWSARRSATELSHIRCPANSPAHTGGVDI